MFSTGRQTRQDTNGTSTPGKKNESSLNIREMMDGLSMAFSASEPVQMQEEEEEEIQKKEAPVQQQFEEGQEKEEEKPVQGKAAPAQFMVEKEGEKPIQAKDLHTPIQTISTGTATKMPEGVQAKMQGSFGTDFSNVNIHQNDNSATEMGALAYTQGNDVHFASGQYNPNTQAGQELLGHELTHVVQQREGRVKPTKQGKGLSVNDNPSLEHEADVMGARAATGKDVSVKGKGNGVQKQEGDVVDTKTLEDQEKIFQNKLNDFINALNGSITRLKTCYNSAYDKFDAYKDISFSGTAQVIAKNTFKEVLELIPYVGEYIETAFDIYVENRKEKYVNNVADFKIQMVNDAEAALVKANKELRGLRTKKNNEFSGVTGNNSEKYKKRSEIISKMQKVINENDFFDDKSVTDQIILSALPKFLKATGLNVIQIPEWYYDIEKFGGSNYFDMTRNQNIVATRIYFGRGPADTPDLGLNAASKIGSFIADNNNRMDRVESLLRSLEIKGKKVWDLNEYGEPGIPTSEVKSILGPDVNVLVSNSNDERYQISGEKEDPGLYSKEGLFYKEEMHKQGEKKSSYMLTLNEIENIEAHNWFSDDEPKIAVNNKVIWNSNKGLPEGEKISINAASIKVSNTFTISAYNETDLLGTVKINPDFDDFSGTGAKGKTDIRRNSRTGTGKYISIFTYGGTAARYKVTFTLS